MSLAITEPYGGSDVSSLQTTAVDKGEYFLVNGTKKFITGGNKADYFTTAVRTGKAGIGGISLLLVERESKGLTIKKIKTQG